MTYLDNRGKRSLADRADLRTNLARRRLVLVTKFTGMVESIATVNEPKRILISKLAGQVLLSEQIEERITAGKASKRDEDSYGRLGGSIARLFKQLGIYDVDDEVEELLNGEPPDSLVAYCMLNHGTGLSEPGSRVYDEPIARSITRRRAIVDDDAGDDE